MIVTKTHDRGTYSNFDIKSNFDTNFEDYCQKLMSFPYNLIFPQALTRTENWSYESFNTCQFCDMQSRTTLELRIRLLINKINLG